MFTVVADSAPINPLVNSAAQGIIAKLRPRAVKAATTVAKGRKKRNFESKDDRVRKKIQQAKDPKVIDLSADGADDKGLFNVEAFLCPRDWEGLTIPDTTCVNIITHSLYMQPGYDNYVAIYVDPETKMFPVCYNDFRRYSSKLFITDQVVNAFFFLLGNKFGNHNARFGNSSLWTAYMSLEHRDDEQVTRILGTLVTSEVDKAFIPVFVNKNHWFLCLISIKEQCLHVYDSLDSTYALFEQRMLQYLCQVLNPNIKWSINNHQGDRLVQCQNDNYSCAFFTCWYAYQLASGSPITMWEDDWSARTAKISLKIMASLVSGRLTDNLFNE